MYVLKKTLNKKLIFQHIQVKTGVYEVAISVNRKYEILDTKLLYSNSLNVLGTEGSALPMCWDELALVTGTL